MARPHWPPSLPDKQAKAPGFALDDEIGALEGKADRTSEPQNVADVPDADISIGSRLMRPNPRISCLRAALFLRSIGIAAAASERPAMIAPVEPRSRDAHLPSAGCMVCMAASWSCAACRSKGSMWSPSRPQIRTAPARRSPSKPDDTPEGQTLDEFFVGHHPIVGRRQQTIDPLQPERSMERDGLAGRPHRHRRGTSLKLGGANLGFARQRDFSASSRAHPHRAPYVPWPYAP